MSMKALSSLLCLCFWSLVYGADDSDRLVQIDCESGSVDAASRLESLSDAECVSRCLKHCSNVSDETEADTCLAGEELLGCLYDISQLKEVEAKYCQTSHSSLSDPSAAAPSLVLQIDKDDLAYFANGDDVQDVYLAINITNPEIYQLCANYSITMGISLENVDTSNCRYSGVAGATQRFGISGTNILSTNITSLVVGAFGSTSPLTLFVEFLDASCGVPKVQSVVTKFSLSYKSGYRPTTSCMSIDTCSGCLANGCSWCDWSETVKTLLPGWFPDWKWISEAREANNGLCGINGAICGASLGRINTCHSLPTIKAILTLLFSIYTYILLAH